MKACFARRMALPWISANDGPPSLKAGSVIPVSHSDTYEETFYIWGDAQYTPHSATWIPTSSDFTYTGRWPDPESMVDTLHENGIKVLLWQLPVIKSASDPIQQLATDEAYAISQGYVLDDGTGTPYRNKGGWYGNAVMPDFTNSAAVSWWMNKRAYLLEEIGIDGFKCDGGEFVWGRNITASNGMKGDELRRIRILYVQAYSDSSRNTNGRNGVFFSERGGFWTRQVPRWVGSFQPLQLSYRVCLRAK